MKRLGYIRPSYLGFYLSYKNSNALKVLSYIFNNLTIFKYARKMIFLPLISSYLIDYINVSFNFI